MRRRFGGPTFTMLAPKFPWGSDPSRGPIGNPPFLRHTVTAAPVRLDRGSIIGRMNADPLGIALQEGEFTVANNDFSDRAVLILGEYRLVSNIDFMAGAGVNATATNIAAAISRVRGFSATAVLAVVTVEYSDGPISEVDFRSTYFGTVINFTPFAPTNGFLETGRPAIAAPLLA